MLHRDAEAAGDHHGGLECGASDPGYSRERLRHAEQYGGASNGLQGTITFRAYGPDDATCGTAVYTSVVNVTAAVNTYSSADGDGGPFAPTAPGVYRWRAFYAPAAGDVNNQSANTPCNDPNESFTVEQFQPALTTAQTWTVKDSATVTVSGGGALAVRSRSSYTARIRAPMRARS